MNKENKKPNLKILFSIVAAIALWLFVVFSENPAITMWDRGVEVDIVGERTLESQGLVVVKAVQPTVDVKLSGTRQGFFEKEEGDVTAQIDVSNIEKAGTYTLNVKTIVSTQDAKVMENSPSQLEIVVEPLVSVEKKVNVKTTGSCAAGFSVKEILVPTVTVTGPESIVNSISLQADDISVADASKDIEAKRTVYMVNENGKKIVREDCSVGKRTITVTCEVQYKKSVPVETEIIGQEADGYDYSFRTSLPQATIYGDKGILDTIEGIKTEPVDITGITSMREVDVNLDLPEGVSVPSGTKATITIQPIIVSSSGEE